VEFNSWFQKSIARDPKVLVQFHLEEKQVMKLHYSNREDGIRLIKLNGRLDGLGVDGIEVEFIRLCTGDGLLVLVDLSGVSYMSSIGIPMLVGGAKLVFSRNGKMALCKPRSNVEFVLDMAGISQIIPIYKDMKAAVLALTKLSVE